MKRVHLKNQVYLFFYPVPEAARIVQKDKANPMTKNSGKTESL